MPKITFIKNVDDEIIYPKTHEDAILTTDGLSISSKIQKIYDLMNHKSDDNHTHDYSTLTGVPTGFTADGGNADTVGGRAVNDLKTGSSYLWTSSKIANELSVINTAIASKSFINISAAEPLSDILWIDTANNVLKYKQSGNWVILGNDLKFQVL